MVVSVQEHLPQQFPTQTFVTQMHATCFHLCHGEFGSHCRTASDAVRGQAGIEQRVGVFV